VNADTSSRRCTRCGESLPADSKHFAPRRDGTSGLTSWCRQCLRTRASARQAQRRRDPTERTRVVDEKKRYARSERGRERKRLESLIDNHRKRAPHLPFLWSLEKREAMMEAWSRTCAYCGAAGELGVDHVVPISAPSCPGTVPWNLVPACESCNSSKHDVSLEAWASPTVAARVVAYLSVLAPYL
jgi:5-methylcytosine-specific restriction endonuclease McrA